MANYKEMAVPPNQEKITVEQIPPSYTSYALAEFLSQQTGKDFSQDRYYPYVFTERVEGFPNGEELGKELAKINNIHWFRPKQESNTETLQRLAQDSLRRLKYPSISSIPLKIISENWGEALDAARSEAWGATRGVAQDATWIVVKDLMPTRGYSKGNPFEPLIEIYKLGCWPIGPVTTKKRE